jgi:hypothetical protein
MWFAQIKEALYINWLVPLLDGCGRRTMKGDAPKHNNVLKNFYCKAHQLTFTKYSP